MLIEEVEDFDMQDDAFDGADAAADSEDEDDGDGSKPRSGGGEAPGRGRGRAGGRGRHGGKRGNAGRKVRKEGDRCCPTCTKIMPADMFPKGCDKRHACKRAVNNLFNAAERSNELDWYYEQMNDASKRKRLVGAYLKTYPEVANKKRSPCSILSLKQSIKGETAVDTVKLGEMMWIGHAIHHFQKPKNGGFDVDEIKAMFKAACETPGALVDEEGPKKARVRVWMKTKDIVG